MKIGVNLLPAKVSSSSCPGHMCVWWRQGTTTIFRGFHFSPSDLPAKFRDLTKWREYLFDHAVPGYVQNDLFMRDWAEEHAASMLHKAWNVPQTQGGMLALRCAPGPQGRYSFNPDDHPGAFNCVTWATERINEAAGPVLPKVRQGRIKLMAAVLKSHETNDP